MPWNLLILPLVAGYFILTRSYFFKFRQQRLDSQRLVFETVLIAIVVACTTYGVRILVGFIPFFQGMLNWIYDQFPIKTPLLGTSIATIFIAFVFTQLGNLLYRSKEKEFIKRAIKNVGNELERHLEISYTEDRLLQITLSNGKFYIGWVNELPIPSVSNYIRLLPAISGFRNEHKELVLQRIIWMPINSFWKKNPDETLNIDIVLGLKDITSVSFFDQELYKQFNNA